MCFGVTHPHRSSPVLRIEHHALFSVYICNVVKCPVWKGVTREVDSLVPQHDVDTRGDSQNYRLRPRLSMLCQLEQISQKGSELQLPRVGKGMVKTLPAALNLLQMSLSSMLINVISICWKYLVTRNQLEYFIYVDDE